MTFSVEIENSEEIQKGAHSVEIYLDQGNLASLIQRLSLLIDKAPGEHLHFMSESWGLGDLSEKVH